MGNGAPGARYELRSAIGRWPNEMQRGPQANLEASVVVFGSGEGIRTPDLRVMRAGPGIPSRPWRAIMSLHEPAVRTEAASRTIVSSPVTRRRFATICKSRQRLRSPQRPEWFGIWQCLEVYLDPFEGPAASLLACFRRPAGAATSRLHRAGRTLGQAYIPRRYLPIIVEAL